MKKIVIYQENSETLTLLDNDDSDINLYSKEISKILELSKVCIISTTSGNAVIKPSKIKSILVSELLDNINKKIKKGITSDDTKDVIKD
jgi:hypothetical protein